MRNSSAAGSTVYSISSTWWVFSASSTSAGGHAEVLASDDIDIAGADVGRPVVHIVDGAVEVGELLAHPLGTFLVTVGLERGERGKVVRLLLLEPFVLTRQLLLGFPLLSKLRTVLALALPPSYMCRSDPQILVVVIRTRMSVGRSMRATGTSLTLTLRGPS